MAHMYGPAVRRKRVRRSVGSSVLHQCIRPLIGAYAPDHHGYQRACVLISSPPGLAGPAAHETLLFCGRVVGTEVAIRLVQLSPFISWTRGSWSTSDCRHGPPSAP